MNFSLFITQPRGWSHMMMFADVGRSIAYALRQLGHDVQFDPGDGPRIVNPKPPFGRSIILAPNFLVDCPLAENAILFNFEQVPGKIGGGPGEVDALISDAWLSSDILNLYRRHTVWDYSAKNIEHLKILGVEDVRHCRVGYTPNLSCIEPVEEDIDVLMYGTLSTSPRRAAILQALIDKGYRVQALQGVYGPERDSWIARSKIILNIHNNPPEIAPAIFETVRCSYLWANKKCVVSESGSQDSELDRLGARGSAYVPYEMLIETCVVLLDSSDMRADIAMNGYEAINEIDQAKEVQRALDDL